MIGKLCLVLTVARISLTAAAATSPAELFTAANKAYEQGQFAQAAILYEGVITNGVSTGPVWFNLGNARFKAGDPGRAIAAWRMAEFSMPRDSALRANLAFARRKVNGAAQETLALGTITQYLTANEWAAAAAVLWIGFFATLAVAQWRRRTAKPSLLLILGCGALLLATAAVHRFVTAYKQTCAVVIRSTVARFGPLEDSQIAFQVADGAEFRILDSTSDWVQVRDIRGKVGWIKKGDVAFVSQART